MKSENQQKNVLTKFSVTYRDWTLGKHQFLYLSRIFNEEIFRISILDWKSEN